MLTPAVLVVLAATLGRNSARWCIGLMTMLFALEILVPETLFLALPTAAVVVAADFVDRDRSARLRAAFRRSYWFFGTGAVLCLAWALYLAANRALGAFVNYYLIFGPGHDASGAHGPGSDIRRREWIEFGLVVGLVLLTYAAAVVHARRRTPWTPRHWVTIAAAGFTALYGEKALGRFDPGHVAQAFTAALPLVFLWAERFLSGLDRGVRRGLRRLARRGRWGFPVGVRHPAGIAALAVATLVVPALFPSHSVASRLDRIPGNEHAVSGRLSPVAHLGYAQPGAVDVALLDDLRTLLDTYAGRTGRIFDMSNSLGYFYYLLGRLPATRFVHVSMAIPWRAERAHRRPAGQPTGRRGVRHHQDRAAALGRHRQRRPPLRGEPLRVEGLDPVRAGRGGAAHAAQRPHGRQTAAAAAARNTARTGHLYDLGRTCDWGDEPNFLPTRPAGPARTVPVRALGRRTITTVTGWAVDPATRTSARSVILVRHGRVVGSGAPFRVRPGVAKALGGYGGTSGFEVTSFDAGSGPLAVLALTSDGRLHALRDEPAGASIPSSVRLPDGTRLAVARPTRGTDRAHEPNPVHRRPGHPAGGYRHPRLRPRDLPRLASPGPLADLARRRRNAQPRGPDPSQRRCPSPDPACRCA